MATGDFTAIFLDGKSAEQHPVTFSLDSATIYIYHAEQVQLAWKDLNHRDSLITNKEVKFVFYEFPQQVVRVRGQESVARLLPTLERNGIRLRRWSSYSTKILLTIAASFLALLAIVYFSLPWISRTIAHQIPFSVEQQLSNDMIINLLAEQDAEVLEDSTWHDANNAFLEYIDTGEMKIKVRLINSQLVNAFALPGGQIVVFTGLLRELPGPESYFALLGHEAGHAVNRHIMQKLVESSILAILIGSAFGDFTSATAVLANMAGELTSLSYSRNMESEADQFALEQIRSNRFSASGLVDLFNTLDGQLQMPQSLEMLSTHPDTGKRLQMAEGVAADEQADETTPLPEDLQKAWHDIKEIISKLSQP